MFFLINSKQFLEFIKPHVFVMVFVDDVEDGFDFVREEVLVDDLAHFGELLEIEGLAGVFVKIVIDLVDGDVVLDDDALEFLEDFLEGDKRREEGTYAFSWLGLNLESWAVPKLSSLLNSS